MAIINNNDTCNTTVTETSVEVTMKKEKKEKKQVSFHGRVKFRRVPYPSSREEIDALWYSAHEMQAAKQTERQLRTYISQDEALVVANAENLSVLGLRTEAEKKSKLALIRGALLAVLKEQQKQEKDFFSSNDIDWDQEDHPVFTLDMEQISNVMLPFTQQAAQDALERGIEKAKHVQQLNDDDEEQEGTRAPSSSFVKDLSKTSTYVAPKLTRLTKLTRMTCTNAAA